jgi:hypothetical protein
VRTSADLLIGQERLADALIDVLPAERFCRRRKDRHLGNIRGERAVQAFHIRDEGGSACEEIA